MNMTSVRKQLIAKLNNKEYRDAFIAEQIFTRLPLKIRFLRDAKNLTQKQLGQRAGIAQTWVSKLEDQNYGKLTISTLLKIASALDVGLQIDFVPYSRVLDAALELSPTTFGVASFADDVGLAQQPTSATGIVTPTSALSMGIAKKASLAAARARTQKAKAREEQMSLKARWRDDLYISQGSVVGTVSQGASGDWFAYGCMDDWEDARLSSYEKKFDAKKAVEQWANAYE